MRCARRWFFVVVFAFLLGARIANTESRAKPVLGVMVSSHAAVVFDASSRLH